MATTNVDIVVSTKGQGSLNRLNQSLGKTDSISRKLTQGLGGAVAKLGLLTGAAVSLGSAFRVLQQQDFAIAKVKTLGVESDKLVANLKEVSAELRGQASVAELTGAAYDVASAGFTNAADAAKVLKAASLGATGGFSDINTVGNAATSVLNAYGKSASEAERLVDQFIQTQNDGKIVVAEYAQNIGKVASAAAGLKIPLSEVNAVIAQSTAAGVQSEVAFTGLKGALARLASGEAAKALKDFGIEISAATIESDGLLGTLKKLEGLDTGTLFKALGTEAGPALLPVIQNLERFEELIENQKNSAGAAAEAQKKAASTITGALKSVQTAFENLITSGQGLSRIIVPAFQGLARIIEALNGPIGVVVGALGGLALAWYAAAKAAGVYAAAQAAATGSGAAAALAGLATKLGLLTGVLTTTATGWSAAGVATTKTVLAIKGATGAVVALKVAMLALPWVAVGAAIAGLAKLTFDYYKKQADLNRLLTDSSVSTNELKDAVSAKKAELEAASGKLDKLRESSLSSKRATEAQRKKVEELQRQLEALEGVYNVKIEIETLFKGEGSTFEGIKSGGYAKGNDGLTYTVAGVTYDARTGKPVTKAPQAFKPPTGGDGDGGGGGGRESQLPQLQQELDLSNKLLENDRQRLEAQFNNNTALINKLAQDRIELELAGQKAAIALEDIPAAEKKLKVALAENAATLQTLELKNQIAEAERQRVEALEGITQPLEDEIELLQAKLNGNEDEIKQLQEIKKLKEQILQLDPNADTSQIEAMVKQRDAMREQVEEMEKTKELVGQISGTIASEFTSAISSVIQGTKTVDEAFADMLKNIGQSFIDMAMKIIEQQIQMIIYGMIMKALGIGGGAFGSGASAPSIGTSTNYFDGSFTPMDFFADGGRPSVNEVSVVGERGPELFVPDQPGRIISNEQSRAAMSMYSPSNQHMAAEGPLTSTINYNGPTLRFNSEDYIPRSEAGALVSAGAKQGEQRAMNRLRQSRSTRSKIGF